MDKHDALTVAARGVEGQESSLNVPAAVKVRRRSWRKLRGGLIAVAAGVAATLTVAAVPASAAVPAEYTYAGSVNWGLAASRTIDGCRFTVSTWYNNLAPNGGGYPGVGWVIDHCTLPHAFAVNAWLYFSPVAGQLGSPYLNTGLLHSPSALFTVPEGLVKETCENSGYWVEYAQFYEDGVNVINLETYQNRYAGCL